MRVRLPRYVDSHPNRPHRILRVVYTRRRAGPRAPVRRILAIAGSMDSRRTDMETDLEHDHREDDALTNGRMIEQTRVEFGG